MMIIRPQPGPQEAFLASSADITIYGGAAGGGKSFALLLEPLRHFNNPRFKAAILRQNHTQIFAQGALWDESSELYNNIPGARSVRSPRPRWIFPSGASVMFSHIESDRDLRKWQGTQLALLGFDELTHFSEKTFFYMLSRNRSTSGVKPYVRATCNPDADSWVAQFISWWIDAETGYPIAERIGKIRWFIRRNEVLYWADNPEELFNQFDLKTAEEKAEPKSVTFIASTLYDNKILMQINPGYLANLKALTVIERERLLHGNWKIKPAAGLYFKRTQVGNILRVIPDDVVLWVRAWDLAATAQDEGGDPAYTAGILMGKRRDGRYIIADVTNERQNAADVRQTIKLTAQEDIAKYKRVRIRIPQDPGQAGKSQAQSFIKLLSGFDITTVLESGSKETRAEPMAAQWQAGNFDIVYGEWNEMYLNQLESFPMSKFKDMIDASSAAFAEIEERTKFNLGSLIS